MATISYLRVSTKDQATRNGLEEGLSIPAQREAAQRKAEQLGILASMAEFYSLNLAQEVLKGMTQKAAIGGTRITIDDKETPSTHPTRPPPASSPTPPSTPRPTSPQKQNCPAIRRGKFRFSHLTWS